MGKLQQVLIMAGGTGGHVFPGLAVAATLKEAGIKVDWLGTKEGLESKLVPAAHIPIHYISISGVRRKGLKDLFFAPFRLAQALIQALRIIRRLKPDVILGMGGFVSGPGGIASWLLGIPLIIHEQNAKAGTTNKWLAHVAKKILEGFPDTFANPKAILVGNPVRHELINLSPPAARLKNTSLQPLRLLVVGGSLGARAINELVPQALAKLSPDERPEVVHQTGEKNFLATCDNYTRLKVTATIKPFIDNMAEAYAWADVVLCRAGALTIAELCTVGLGAILVPFPYAVDDHQTANALFMVRNNAAELIQQADLTVDKLAELLKELSIQREKCYGMAQSAYKSRKINAAESVLKICEEICQ